MMILCGLPDEWDTVVSALCNLPENEFTCATVKRRLLVEDSRRQENNSKQTAMFMESKKTFHPKNQNDKKKGDPKPDMSKNKYRKSDTTCFYCHKKGHIAKNCYKKVNSEKQNIVNMSTVCGTITKCKDTWIKDSGATHHMIPKEEYFSKIDRNTQIQDITMADGTKTSTTGKGTVSAIVNSVNSRSVVNFEARNTLLVPKISYGILSVKQLVENNKKVLFNEKGCFIYDTDGNLLIEAKEKDRLFTINTEPAKREKSILNSVNRKEKSESLDLWHRRMMHVNKHQILQMKNMESVIGLNCEESSPTQCDSCLLGKSTRQPFPKRPIENTERRTTILELVHSDLMGPVDIPSWGNKKYMLSIIDDASRYVFVRFLKKKSDALSEFKKWKIEVEKQTEKNLKRIRTDNGLEFCSKNWTEFCESSGIRHETTMTYTPQQNGIAERCNRTLLDLVRSQLQESDLPKSAWAELIYTAAYIRNRVTNSHNKEKTPYEIWTGRKPSVRHLRAIGCEVFVHIPKQKRSSKLSKRAEAEFLLDMLYMVEVIEFVKMQYSCDSTSNDNEEDQGEQNNSVNENTVDDTDEEYESLQEEETGSLQDEEIKQLREEIQPLQEEENVTNPTRNPVGRPRKDPTQPKPEPVKHKMTLRSSDKTVHNANSQSFAIRNKENDEPLTYQEAINSSECTECLEAMNEELHSLAAHQSWDLVEMSPGKTPVKCKWVYKRKIVDNKKSLKARLVAKGFTQKKGVDYDDVYAPVSSFETLRLLVAVSVEKKWNIDQYDVKSSYLHGDLKETIYMEQPEGFEQKGKENLVCRLRKLIYGLKQSGRCWNDHLNKCLEDIGFVRNKTDPCVYQMKTEECTAIILVYVDDMLVLTKDETARNKIKELLKCCFEVKHVGEINYMLGVKFERKKSGCITLSQKQYIGKLLVQFGLQNAKGSKTPMEVRPIFDENNESEDLPYRELIGAHGIYLSLRTRPDISFAVTKLAQFSSNFNRSHWNSAKRILRYLKETMDYKLEYKPTGQQLSAFSDADWASSADDRKSTSGYVITLAGSPVYWKTVKQTVIALSTMEAEYVSVAACAREITWMRALLRSLDLEEIIGKSTLILCDSQAAIAHAESYISNSRTKHISIKHHFIREKVKDGTIDLKYIRTNENLADILTKPLGKELHDFHRNRMLQRAV